MIFHSSHDNDRQTQDTTAATAAISNLETLRDEITAAGNTITSLTVRSTHTDNTAESAACQALDSSASVSQLETNCEVQLNKITLAE